LRSAGCGLNNVDCNGCWQNAVRLVDLRWLISQNLMDVMEVLYESTFCCFDAASAVPGDSRAGAGYDRDGRTGSDGNDAGFMGSLPDSVKSCVRTDDWRYFHPDGQCFGLWHSADAGSEPGAGRN